MLNTVVEGLIIGALSALVIIYAFQTRVAYPDVVLRTINHRWLICIIVIVTLLLFKKHPVIAALLLLLEAAFIMDVMLFSRHLRNLVTESPSDQLCHADGIKTIPNDDDANNDCGAPLAAIALPTPIYPNFQMSPEETGRASPF